MKALGIIAMIFAVIAIFVPVIGPYLTIVCAFMAAFSAGNGLTFGAVAIRVNLINISVLSPSLWITAVAASAQKSDQASADDVIMGMGAVFIGAQVMPPFCLLSFIDCGRKNKPQFKVIVHNHKINLLNHFVKKPFFKIIGQLF